jgi:hypothetical protein
MRGIKQLLIFSLVFIFTQCRKDNKIEPMVDLMADGKCMLYMETGPRSRGVVYYHLKDNLIYTLTQITLTKDSICFGRIAGKLYLDEFNKLKISNLHFQDSYTSNPCAFDNDNYGGDTLIVNFRNVKDTIDYYGNTFLIGDFYYLTPSTVPYEKKVGTFFFRTKYN